MPGGPTKLTPELQAAIIADLSTGLFANQVALKNGIHPTTLRDWVNKGLQENAKEPFAGFAEAYIKADIAVEQETLRVIRSGATNKALRKYKNIKRDAETGEETHKEVQWHRGDWRAAGWYAEKRWPTRYGSRALLTPGKDDINTAELLEAAQSRGLSLVELLQDPPPELQEAIMASRDQLLALLTSGEKKLTE